MTLLIDKTCLHCRNIESAVEGMSEIKKFYVTDGMIAFDEKTFIQMDRKIPALPALIVGENSDCKVYCGEKFILEFLNKISQEKK